MEEKDKSLLILQLLDDMLALNVDEIDLETFQRLITAESVELVRNGDVVEQVWCCLSF